MSSKKSKQRKHVGEMHPDWAVTYMEDHLSEIADLAVVSETVPEYLKVMALSLHTLATIEHYRLRSDGGTVLKHEEKANLQKRLEATAAIIQGDMGWGDV